MKLSALLLLFCLLLLCSWQEVTAVASASQLPTTRGALDGLSREALINLILGNSNTPTTPHDTSLKNVSSASSPRAAPPSVPARNATTSSSLPHYSGDKFYLYPLEKKYWWRWPDHNSSCTAHNQVGHNHAMNSGHDDTHPLTQSPTHSVTNSLSR
jgi:hypothetical protein